jgi:hypothetical protein
MRSPENLSVTNLEISARLSWIAVRLILAVWLAKAGQSFVYQGF